MSARTCVEEIAAVVCAVPNVISVKVLLVQRLCHDGDCLLWCDHHHAAAHDAKERVLIVLTKGGGEEVVCACGCERACGCACV